MQIPWDWAFYFLGWCGVCRYGWPSCSHYMVFWFWARGSGPHSLGGETEVSLVNGPHGTSKPADLLEDFINIPAWYCGCGQPSSDPLPIPSLPALFLATFLSLSLFMPISYPFSIIPIYPHANLTVISIPLSHPPCISSSPYLFLVFHATHAHHSSFIPYITKPLLHLITNLFLSLPCYPFLSYSLAISSTLTWPLHAWPMSE